MMAGHEQTSGRFLAQIAGDVNCQRRNIFCRRVSSNAIMSTLIVVKNQRERFLFFFENFFCANFPLVRILCNLNY